MLVLAGVTAAVVVALAAPAAAHATLEATQPGGESVVPNAPREVVMSFSEPVDPGLGGIKVFDPAGRRVDGGRTTRLDGGRRIRTAVEDAGQGTYTVAWSVVSSDSHNLSGSFVYSVGRVSGGATLADGGRPAVRFAGGVGRLLAFAGTALFVGPLAFAALVAGGRLDGARRRRLQRLAMASAAATAVGSAVVVITQVAVASGRPVGRAIALLPDAVTEARFATLGAVRTAAAVCAVPASLVLSRRRLPWLPLAAAATAVLSVVPALAGHAWTTSPRWLAVTVDSLHLLAVAVWIGGLAALLATAPGSDAAQELAGRFSRTAVVAVGVVVATGAASSYFQVRAVDALTGTSFGRLLIAKVVIVAVLVTLGWLNRRRFLRLLPGRSTLFNVVGAEILLAVAVLAVTAVLVNRPPARSDLARPFSATVELNGQPEQGSVQVDVDPARAGANDVHLYFFTAQGLPRPVDAVEVTVGRQGVPPRRVQVTPVTADHASAYGVALPSPGVWTVTVTTVRAGAASVASVDVTLR